MNENRQSGQDKSAFQQLGDDKGEGGERDIRSDSTETSQGQQQSDRQQSDRSRQDELAGAGGQQQQSAGQQGQQSGQQDRQPGQGQQGGQFGRQQEQQSGQGQRQQGDEDLDRDRQPNLGRDEQR